MGTVADRADRLDGGEGEEVVVTRALRSLRQSALRCRRARLIFEEPPSEESFAFRLSPGCVELRCSASLTHGRELLDRPS
jgi:hypothetical protein